MKLNWNWVLNIEVQGCLTACISRLTVNHKIKIWEYTIMKTLLIALATGSLMLAACSSSKPAEEAAAPRVTVEEAMTQCQQASGENADRAMFDACMKDKGYQRTAESAASEPAASELVAAPEAVAPEAAASDPAAKAAPAKAAPAKKAAKKAKK